MRKIHLNHSWLLKAAWWKWYCLRIISDRRRTQSRSSKGWHKEEWAAITQVQRNWTVAPGGGIHSHWNCIKSLTYYFGYYFCIQGEVVCPSAIWKKYVTSMFFLSPVKNKFPNICVYTYKYTYTFKYLYIIFKAENHSLVDLHL